MKLLYKTNDLEVLCIAYGKSPALPSIKEVSVDSVSTFDIDNELEVKKITDFLEEGGVLKLRDNGGELVVVMEEHVQD